jgi:hypothetical protein
VLRETGFEPLDPAVVPADAESAVPDRVLDHAEPASSLGALRLDAAGREGAA